MLDRIRPHLALDENALHDQKIQMLEAAKPHPVGKPESQGLFWDSVNHLANMVTDSEIAMRAGYASGTGQSQGRTIPQNQIT